MKSNWREERTIFRSIRCARIHGSVMNGWDSHSAACIQDVSPSIQHEPLSPAESMATSAALRRTALYTTDDKFGAEVDHRHGRARDHS
jgi:4-hydroxybenzoate polyprenyltransferase